MLACADVLTGVEYPAEIEFMPAKRKQLNILITQEDEELIARLLPILQKEAGTRRYSKSDLFNWGLKELAAKYLPPEQPKKRGAGK